MLSKSLPISSLVALLSLAGFSPLISFWFVRVFFWFANFFFLFCFQKNFSTGRAVDACFCFIIIIIIIVLGGFVNIFSVFEVM